MSSLYTSVRFDVSSVDLFQFMTARMLEYNTRSFLDGKCVDPQLCALCMLVMMKSVSNWLKGEESCGNST